MPQIVATTAARKSVRHPHARCPDADGGTVLQSAGEQGTYPPHTFRTIGLAASIPAKLMTRLRLNSRHNGDITPHHSRHLSLYQEP